ncbi:hypothetical protein I9W82_001068 [Candida metapsilosis]|uniref:Uncharacterized protein n=1 Tax=Candida metapsilosis TaxID=273372 RepID=A0A8H7ZHN8_9ASCO|nr:hypothetical protein I9W82_001068 [Candida metapsilosis]
MDLLLSQIQAEEPVAPPIVIPDNNQGKAAIEVFGEIYRHLFRRRSLGLTATYELYKNNKRTFLRASSMEAQAITYIVGVVYDRLLNDKGPIKATSLNNKKPKQLGPKPHCLYKMLDVFCDIYNFDMFDDLQIIEEPNAVMYSNVALHKRTQLTGDHEPAIRPVLQERLLLVILESEAIPLAAELDFVGFKKPYILLTTKGKPTNYVKNFAAKIAERFVSSVVFIGNKDPQGLNNFMQYRKKIPDITYICINDATLKRKDLAKITKKQKGKLHKIFSSSDSPQFLKDIATELLVSRRDVHLDKHSDLSKRLAELFLVTDFTKYEGSCCELNI